MEYRNFVRGSVGAPTAHACAGNGSHHSEDLPLGRSGPPGEFFWPFVGADTRSGLWCAAPEEPLRLDARDSLARPDLVRREGNPRSRAHPAGRFARVLSQGAERLRSEYRSRGDQRDLRAHSAGARSLRAHVPADPADGAGSRAYRRLALAAELLRLLDGAAGRLAAAFRSLRFLRHAVWFEAGFLRCPSTRALLREVPALRNEAAAL